MNVHNIMEDVVTQHVNVIYDMLKESKAAWLSCDCENCRLDTISYVLNRIPPKYVVSGRGLTYSKTALDEDLQLKADIDALTNEGIRIISETKRPFHSYPRKDCEIKKNEIPVFNFPTFTGTVLDGTTFEPISDATILLKCDGETVEMVDKTWTNPAKTYKSTKGTYSFWIKPFQTNSEGVTQKFNFTLEISAEKYAPVVYSFELPLTSDKAVKNELDSTYSVKIKDMVLFHEDVKNPMED